MWKRLVTSLSKLIVKETLLSVAINTLISAFFMQLLFGGSRLVYVWGAHGLAVDFVPQTVMIAVMSVLVPGLMVRRRLRSGALLATPLPAMPRGWRNLWIQLAVISTTLTLVAATLAIGILAVTTSNPTSFSAAFVFKVVYGAVIAMIATPIGLATAFCGEKHTIVARASVKTPINNGSSTQ